MPRVMCGDCGRQYDLDPDLVGRARCRCGALLEGAPAPPRPAAGAAAAAAPAPSEAGDLAAVGELKAAYQALSEELAQTIVGQEAVIEELLIALFARGHCLLEGVPGLAKTLMVSTLARALDLSFKRIQFTPDLMPSDITGTEMLHEDKATGERLFRFVRGPVFANMILADEINRTPPKTQAALLESMQEKCVTVAGTRHALELPFLVLATQNPLELEGTYPLPEAQLDRFFFKVLVDYPSDEEELEIMKRVTGSHLPAVQPVLNGPQILKLQEVVLRVPVADHVFHYAKRLARATRPNTPEAPEFIRNWVRWGAGPRASLNMILAAKARAILKGEFYASCEDVAAVAGPVMRHRLACNFTAQAEGITTDKVIQRLLEETPQTERLTGEEAGVTAK
jgi:MoxR-like ATPase